MIFLKYAILAALGIALACCSDSGNSVASDASSTTEMSSIEASSLVTSSATTLSVAVSSSSMSSSKVSSATLPNTITSSLAMSSAAMSSITILSSATSSSVSVSPSAYCNTVGNCGTITDERDGQVYKWTKIGDQVWMAENLNYSGDDGIGNKTFTQGWCYGVGGTDTTMHQDSTTCDDGYGRIYTWAEVVGLEKTYNASKATAILTTPQQGICPTGWHVPEKHAYDSLASFIREDSEATEGLGLKGVIHPDPSGWNNGLYNHQDPYGFSALPAGFRFTNGGWTERANITRFWSNGENSATIAWAFYLGRVYTLFDSSIDGKALGYSLRCTKD